MEYYKKYKKYLPHILFILLIISTFFIWYFIYFKPPENHNLLVAFLDVGQGDSIYIEAPNGTQILIDGGPDQKVLAGLSKVMPFGDRSIDLVIVTHTDADHVGGLPSVLDNYQVDSIIDNGASSDTKIYQSLENRVMNKNIKKIIARAGMKIIIDQKKNIYFDILFPDRDASKMESNDGSVVGRLVYGEDSFLFTGDATIYSEVLMHQRGKGNLVADVLKLGHHGSKTSSSELWLEDVRPEIAIISAGKDNRYSHPSKETIDRLNKLKIPYLNTADVGNIIFETDGSGISKK